jgi:hypothetical protein
VAQRCVDPCRRRTYARASARVAGSALSSCSAASRATPSVAVAASSDVASSDLVEDRQRQESHRGAAEAVLERERAVLFRLLRAAQVDHDTDPQLVDQQLPVAGREGLEAVGAEHRAPAHLTAAGHCVAAEITEVAGAVEADVALEGDR